MQDTPSQDTNSKDTVLILHPHFTGRLAGDPSVAKSGAGRADKEQIEEIESLVLAIELEIVQTLSINISAIQPSHFIGSGKCEEIADLVEETKPDVVVFNYSLSPVQQRNLEKAFNCKVIDRTGLILEIFGARAQTKEGRLQVELAALSYQRSRLVRSWTHLERQRGGAGFMGGPGERQIEIDRRLIDQRMTKLKKQLETVQKTRDLGRKARARVPLPVVALVGYTNAGKSTLFNHITGSEVFAKDLLFATLDPTLRRVELPGNRLAILSDTVGFISDLPTDLIAAFRATLEETIYADIIIHVINMASDDVEAQRQDVIRILGDLNIEYEGNTNIIEAYNKFDLIADEDARNDWRRKEKFSDNTVLISAAKGEGIDALLKTISDKLAEHYHARTFALKPEDGEAIAWLYNHADVLEREDKEDQILISVQIDSANLSRFEKQYSKA